jgi:hypothetical protein
MSSHMCKCNYKIERKKKKIRTQIQLFQLNFIFNENDVHLFSHIHLKYNIM